MNSIAAYGCGGAFGSITELDDGQHRIERQRRHRRAFARADDRMMQEGIEAQRVFAGHDAVDHDAIGGSDRHDVLLGQLLEIGATPSPRP